MPVDSNPMEMVSSALCIHARYGKRGMPSVNSIKGSELVAGSGPFMMTAWIFMLTLLVTGMPCKAKADGVAVMIPTTAPLPVGDSHPFNSRVLAAIAKMPVGGGYAVNRTAAKALGNAIAHDQSGYLSIKAASATPSFCSGAVYLVLLSALKPEIDAIKDPETRRKLIRSLDVTGQPDGMEIWGRWNSNGPCMAVTFAEAGLGRSSWGYKSAVPGDFLKLWWTESIGRDEAGHSVIFLGFRKTESGEDGIESWSSNKPAGYGKKVIPFSKIKHALFSRCEHPERVAGLLRLGGKNDYLAGMLKRNTTQDEINKRISLSVPVPRSAVVR